MLVGCDLASLILEVSLRMVLLGISQGESQLLRREQLNL